MKRKLAATTAVFSALATLAVAAFAAGPIVISQKGKVFAPGRIAVQAGTTVRILNDDRVLHHVYIESPDFNYDSGEQQPGETVEITFAEDGTFAVRCDIHPKMLLTVVVR